MSLRKMELHVTDEQARRIEDMLRRDEEEKKWEENKDKQVLSFKEVVSCVSEPVQSMYSPEILHTVYIISRQKLADLFRSKFNLKNEGV